MSKLIIYYEARTLFGLGVSRCQTRVGVGQRHLWLHWIMSFSQIIIRVRVFVSVSCLVSMSVSVLHIYIPIKTIFPSAKVGSNIHLL